MSLSLDRPLLSRLPSWSSTKVGSIVHSLIAAFIKRRMSCEVVNATDMLSVDAGNIVELLAVAGLCSARVL